MEFFKSVFLLISGSAITLYVQLFLKRKDNTDKKNNMIREKLEQAYELSIESHRWLSLDTIEQFNNPNQFDKVRMLIAIYAPELTGIEERLQVLEYQFFTTRARASNEKLSGKLTSKESEKLIEDATLNLLNCHYELRQQIIEVLRKIDK